MLQRHRAGAKQLSSFHCSLQQASLIVTYPLRKHSAKAYYTTFTPLQVENSTSQGVAQREHPKKWNESRRISHELWQEKNRAAIRYAFGAISVPTKGPSNARFFSNSITMHPNQKQDRMVKLGVPPGKNTTVSRLGSSSLRRNILASSHQKRITPSAARSVPATRSADLVDRFRRLEAQMNKVRNKENLNMAFECFGVLEKAIEDIVKSESGATPVSDLESIVEKPEEGAQEAAATTDAETPALMGFPVNTKLIDLEDLEFATEPDLPYVSLTEYQIPEDVLQSKQLLKDGSINKTWSYLLYRDSNLEPPKVHYCKTLEQAEQVAALFLNDKVLGFDIEWDAWMKAENSTPRSHVSLVQIANQSDIALFHLSIFKCDDQKLLPKNLRKIIVSKDILKVGVCITGDAQRIYKHLKVVPQGLFELSDLQNLLDTIEKGGGSIPRRLISLSTLTSENLLLPLHKGKVRLSRWKTPLTDKQIEYVASDAYAGLRVFDALEGKRNELRPFPPLPPCRTMVRMARGTSLVVQKTKRVLKKSLSIKSTYGSIGEETEEIAGMSFNTGDGSGETGTEGKAVKRNPLRKSYKGPEIGKAENWVSEYISEKGTPAASSSQLRAYAMWYEGGHELEEISRFLRDPPLKLRTVAECILEAIRLEGLPYEKGRVKDLVDNAGPMSTSPWKGTSELKKWM